MKKMCPGAVKRGGPVKSRQKSSSTKPKKKGQLKEEQQKMVWAGRGLNRHTWFALRHQREKKGDSKIILPVPFPSGDLYFCSSYALMVITDEGEEGQYSKWYLSTRSPGFSYTSLTIKNIETRILSTSV